MTHATHPHSPPTLVAMTQEELASGGKQLLIHYTYHTTPLGLCIVASTAKGLCYLAFGTSTDNMRRQMVARLPGAQYVEEATALHTQVVQALNNAQTLPAKVVLHVKASPFQLQVWTALASLASGQLSTYGKIAQEIGRPTASRAVGTAVGSNPIAYFIPCHRIVRGNGQLGGYRWGTAIKKQVLEQELSATDFSQLK